MPEQKTQAVLQRRLLVIETIRRLSGRQERWVTVAEIVRDLKDQGYAVEIYSVRRDMKALLDTHQHLECNDNSGLDGAAKNGLAYGYRWVGRDQEQNGGITLPEALSLVMVEKYLSQSLPVLLSRPLQDIFSKAHNILELHKKSNLTHWPEKISVIQPTQPFITPVIDTEVLIAVHEALLNEQLLIVSYQSLTAKEGVSKTLRLHPLGLVKRGNIAYLAAMTNDYENAYFYALHRIQSAQIQPEKCRQKKGFDLNEFAATQGHFGPASPIHLKARVCDQLAQILEESPLNALQSLTVKDTSGYRILEANVLDTWQLQWWILGEAERIEVLEPHKLRQTILSALTKTITYYG
jgi:predicted DNA-binding transcriptional regulator YafY